MKQAIVIINGSHSLLPEQEEILNKNYSLWEVQTIPPEGLTLDQQLNLATLLFGEGGRCEGWDAVFASPVPALLNTLAHAAGSWAHEVNLNYRPHTFRVRAVRVFHNDRRVAREIPDGRGGVKLIHTVAAEGWQLV